LQPLRSPLNEYVNGCDVVLRPGENEAVPFSWHSPPLAAGAAGAVARNAATTTATTKRAPRPL
jgi:hypothetical protein